MDVVALGELLIDFTCTGVDAQGYPALQAHPGGAPANFLAAVAKFGGNTAFLGKVGQDAFGSMLLKTLEDAGISTKGLIRDPDHFTTLAFVTLDDHGDRDFSFARKPGADTCLEYAELALDLIDDSKVFHFGTLSLTDEPARSTTRRAVDYAKGLGKWISFDPNLRKPLWNSLDRAREEMLWGLSQSDIVKISDEEADFLFGLEPEAAAKYILKHFGVKLVFVTCGSRGCFFQNSQEGGFMPSLGGIQALDTTGAGDIFGGSALWSLLQTGKQPEYLNLEELRYIAAFASAAAGLSVTNPGGISSVPEYDAVVSALAKWRKNCTV